jgi:hypothetical protein
MASTIPHPHVPFASGSNSLLDVPRPGALSLFLIPRLLHPGFCFGVCCITFLSISMFFEFFLSLCRSSPHRFRCPPSIAELLSHPHASTVLFFVQGQRTRDRFFSLYFFLLVFSYVAFLFPIFHLLFACNNALALMVRLDHL